MLFMWPSCGRRSGNGREFRAVASRTSMITPMPYHLLSYYSFRMGA
jgi:hypothetical protein